jgi:hypothetical protein
MKKLLQHRWILIGILLAGLALRLAWAFLPLETLLLTLEDDAWMVTAIARHWALGHGITADGLTPTNGFHPLYPLTFGALPFLFAPDNLALGFRLNMVICALLNTLALLPLYGLLRHFSRPRLALLGTAAIALNPYFVRTSVNAMETSLALLLLLAFWWYALQPAALTPRRSLILGALAATATLARLDSLIAAALIGAWLLGRELHARRVTPWPFVYGGVTLGLLVPYFVRNVVVFGALSPSSGRALAYLHSYRESFTFSGGVQLLAYNSLIYLEWLPTLALAALIAALGGLLWALRGPTLARLAPLVLYALSLTLYYSYIQQQGSPRYYGGVSIVLLVVLWSGLETIADWRSGRLVQPALIALVLIGLNSAETIGYIRQQRTAPSASQTASYQAALWIRDNLPPEARLGAQNSGIMQYYSGHVVLNFDGKLNHEIIPVLERRELNRYLADKGIQYVVDLPEVEGYLEFYSARFSDAKPHREVGTLGKLAIYARLILHKLGLGAAVELDVRVPTSLKRPFRADATIIYTAPLPNNPERAVTVYQLAPSFGNP